MSGNKCLVSNEMPLKTCNSDDKIFCCTIGRLNCFDMEPFYNQFWFHCILMSKIIVNPKLCFSCDLYLYDLNYQINVMSYWDFWPIAWQLSYCPKPFSQWQHSFIESCTAIGYRLPRASCPFNHTVLWTAIILCPGSDSVISIANIIANMLQHGSGWINLFYAESIIFMWGYWSLMFCLCKQVE